MVASPHTSLPAGEDLVDRLADLAAAESCETVVVGLPKGMSGRDTASTQMARAVAKKLAERGLNVQLWDERLSSAEAERVLLSAGRRREQRKVERDPIAAAIILQGWLDARRSS
jgi:putative holliday junction resolvase